MKPINDLISGIANNPTVADLTAKLQENPDIRNSLVAALAAGGAGALATSFGGERRGESPGSRRLRILKNGLMAAGLGGGAAYALQKGIGPLMQPVPGNAPDAIDDVVGGAVDVTRRGVGGVLTSPYAVGAGAAAGYAASNPGWLAPGSGGKFSPGTERARYSLTQLLAPLNNGGSNAATDMMFGNSHKGLSMADALAGERSTPDSVRAALRAMQGGGGPSFRGVDIDKQIRPTIATHDNPLSNRESAMQELIKAHSGGGRSPEAATNIVKRLLNESGAVYGDGVGQNIRRILGGLSDRTGISDVANSVRTRYNEAIANAPGNRSTLSQVIGGAVKDKLQPAVTGLKMYGDAAKQKVSETASKVSDKIGLPKATNAVKKFFTQTGISNAASRLKEIANGALAKAKDKVGLGPEQVQKRTEDRAKAKVQAAEVSKQTKAQAANKAKILKETKSGINEATSGMTRGRLGRSVAGAGAGALAPYLLGKLIEPRNND